jgi:catechol 2,3-dioxygenase-like lactoylglutathione lyase family enzyme
MLVQINHLQHVGIPVQNLVRSETFYEKLGFNNVMSSEFRINGEKGNVAMMQNGSVIIELYQMPPAELAEIKTRKDGRIDHIAFDVNDIDTCFQNLKNAGFEMIEEQPVKLDFWVKGCKYFNISGPDGERLEFNEIIK